VRAEQVYFVVDC